MKKMLTLVAVLAVLNGCAVHTPSGSVVLNPNGGKPASGGKFCPPGQAKKGNC